MSEAEWNASYRGGYDAGYTKGHEDGYNAALRAQEQNDPLTCEGCVHERCGAPEIEDYCWICKRSHPYPDRYEPTHAPLEGADE